MDPVRRIAEALCYQHCRAGFCKDEERCRCSYPGPGYSWFEAYLNEAVALINEATAASKVGLWFYL